GGRRGRGRPYGLLRPRALLLHLLHDPFHLLLLVGPARLARVEEAGGVAGVAQPLLELGVDHLHREGGESHEHGGDGQGHAERAGALGNGGRGGCRSAGPRWRELAGLPAAEDAPARLRRVIVQAVLLTLHDGRRLRQGLHALSPFGSDAGDCTTDPYGDGARIASTSSRSSPVLRMPCGTSAGATSRVPAAIGSTRPSRRKTPRPASTW